MQQKKKQIVIIPDVYRSNMSYAAMVLWAHVNSIGICPAEFPHLFIHLMGLDSKVIVDLAMEIKEAKMDWWNRD